MSEPDQRGRDELAPKQKHRDNLAVGAKVSKTKRETALAAQQSYQQFTAYDSPPPAARAIIDRLKQQGATDDQAQQCRDEILERFGKKIRAALDGERQ